MHMLADPSVIRLERHQLGKLARTSVRAAHTGWLSCARGAAPPWVAKSRIACTHEGSPIVQAEADESGTATLVVENDIGGLAVMVQGHLEAVGDDRLRRRFFRRHGEPESDVSPARLRLLRVERACVQCEDEDARWLEAADYLFDTSTAEALLEAEEGIVAHVNGGHPDVVHAIVSHRGLGADDWQLVGCDPEGLDLMRQGRLARVNVDAPVRSREEFKRTMIGLRAAGGGGIPPDAEQAAE